MTATSGDISESCRNRRQSGSERNHSASPWGVVPITILRKTDLEISFYPESVFRSGSLVSLRPSSKISEKRIFPQIVDKSHYLKLETLYMVLKMLPDESMVQKSQSRAIRENSIPIDKHDF